MTVNQENIEQWGAYLQVSITPDDYSLNVKKKLAEQQKKTILKGFRTGMVPASLVKKMYGTSILVDVINHILSELLEKHIKDNSLPILGQPIPALGKENKADWENPSDFSFWFEVAFVPQLKFDLTKIEAVHYDIQADEGTINKHIENLKARVGGEDIAMDEEFFKKMYPNDNIKTEEELREKIRTEIEQFYTHDAERTFSKNVFDAIAEKTDINIPKEFLIRWIECHNEKQKLSVGEIEKHFDEYEKSLKRQFVEAQIIKDENIKIGKDDLRTFYRNDVLSRYYPVSSGDPEMEEQIEKITDNAFAEQKTVNQLYDMLLDKRLLAVFKEKVVVRHEKITFNEFMEKAYGQMTAEHEHSEDCGCEEHEEHEEHERHNEHEDGHGHEGDERHNEHEDGHKHEEHDGHKH
jgi:FKBP-type peptidyl-prolyl cis-trans isomerase (trigger factor)